MGPGPTVCLIATVQRAGIPGDWGKAGERMRHGAGIARWGWEGGQVVVLWVVPHRCGVGVRDVWVDAWGWGMAVGGREKET